MKKLFLSAAVLAVGACTAVQQEVGPIVTGTNPIIPGPFTADPKSNGLFIP